MFDLFGNQIDLHSGSIQSSVLDLRFAGDHLTLIS
jgi:hypothetical protein